MKLKLTHLTAAAVFLATAAFSGGHMTEVKFGSNWLAQAEHGGFYQSAVDGTYEACGLKVSILPGGPQVNNRALLLAGKIDYHMGGDLLQAFNAVKEGIPIVAVAASFQKHPQVIIAHPGEAEKFEDLKDLTLLIGDNGYQGFYQWMIAAYGFTPDQRQPYTFNPAPFLVTLTCLRLLRFMTILFDSGQTEEEECSFQGDIFKGISYS